MAIKNLQLALVEYRFTYITVNKIQINFNMSNKVLQLALVECRRRNATISTNTHKLEHV